MVNFLEVGGADIVLLLRPPLGFACVCLIPYANTILLPCCTLFFLSFLFPLLLTSLHLLCVPAWRLLPFFFLPYIHACAACVPVGSACLPVTMQTLLYWNSAVCILGWVHAVSLGAKEFYVHMPLMPSLLLFCHGHLQVEGQWRRCHCLFLYVWYLSLLHFGLRWGPVPSCSMLRLMEEAGRHYIDYSEGPGRLFL
jgi:hypothetical protein